MLYSWGESQVGVSGNTQYPRPQSEFLEKGLGEQLLYLP